MFPQSTKISLSTWQVVTWPWFSYAYSFTTLFHKFITILLGLWILAKVTTHYARDRVIRVNNCRWEGCIEQKIRKITCETLDRDFEIEWVIAEKVWYIYEYPSNPNSLTVEKDHCFYNKSHHGQAILIKPVQQKLALLLPLQFSWNNHQEIWHTVCNSVLSNDRSGRFVKIRDRFHEHGLLHLSSFRHAYFGNEPSSVPNTWRIGHYS